MRYSEDLRARVLRLYDQGWKTRAIARTLGLSESWCRRVKQRRHEPRPKVGGGKPKLDDRARLTLAQWVHQTPDATLEELRQRLADRLGLRVSIGTVWNTLRRLKLTLKKSR